MLSIVGWVIVIWLLLIPLRLYIRHKQRVAQRAVAPTYVVVRDGNIVAQPGQRRVAAAPVVASQLPGYMHWGAK